MDLRRESSSTGCIGLVMNSLAPASKDCSNSSMSELAVIMAIGTSRKRGSDLMRLQASMPLFPGR